MVCNFVCESFVFGGGVFVFGNFVGVIFFGGLINIIVNEECNCVMRCGSLYIDGLVLMLVMFGVGFFDLMIGMLLYFMY